MGRQLMYLLHVKYELIMTGIISLSIWLMVVDFGLGIHGRLVMILLINHVANELTNNVTNEWWDKRSVNRLTMWRRIKRQWELDWSWDQYKLTEATYHYISTLIMWPITVDYRSRYTAHMTIQIYLIVVRDIHLP